MRACRNLRKSDISKIEIHTSNIYYYGFKKYLPVVIVFKDNATIFVRFFLIACKFIFAF